VSQSWGTRPAIHTSRAQKGSRKKHPGSSWGDRWWPREAGVGDTEPFVPKKLDKHSLSVLMSQELPTTICSHSCPPPAAELMFFPTYCSIMQEEK